jgi:isoleucyl-tRNA synthetase
VTLVKLLAPFTPFMAEHIYQNIVRGVDHQAPGSVHHNDWPKADGSSIDGNLMAKMDRTIRVSSLGRSARSTSGIKLRQPLAKATVVADSDALDQLRDMRELIAEELNVRELILTSDKGEVQEYEVRPLLDALGAKYGGMLPKVCEAIGGVDVGLIVSRLEKSEPIELTVDGQKVILLPSELELRTKAREGKAIAEEAGTIVAIDISMTEELKEEGIARDIVRRIQNERKAAGFNISDHIETCYRAGPKLNHVLEAYHDYIAEETLSAVLRSDEPPENAHRASFVLAGETLAIGLVIHKRHS